ncbi:MAG: GNAT family N-acetyltransferase [Gammaproteobacteria bacterium]|nr:GNAT family N-acetyltransferase [Gammaproteobacteria bacterium]
MIVGNKIILRTWSENDLLALQTIRNDFQLQQQLMAQPRENSLEQVKQWLTKKTESEDSLLFVIEIKQSNAVAGYVQVVEINFDSGSGRLGICILPSLQGRGYGYEAITLLEKHLSEYHKLRKLVLEVLSKNENALHLYRKLKFKEVGRLRHHFFIDNEYCDSVIMEKFLQP